MDLCDIEQLRRSIAMLPEGHSSVGPLTKDAARSLIDELLTARQESVRYREVVAQLRKLLNTLDD